MTDLNDLDADCKICLVSHLPMVHISMLLQSRTKKLRQMNTMEFENTAAGSAMTGIKGNEFAVTSWKDYY